MSGTDYEMSNEHRNRVIKLLDEPGFSANEPRTRADMIAAYQAVLTKDLLFTMNELLIYKQQEVHR